MGLLPSIDESAGHLKCQTVHGIMKMIRMDDTRKRR